MKINENRFSAQIATVFINWPLFWLLSGVKWDEKECMQLYVNRKKPIIYFQSHFNLSSCVGWFLFFLSEWICHKSATFTQIVYSFFLVGDIARVSETMNLIKSQIYFHPCCYLFLLFIFCGFCWNNISRLYRLPIFFDREHLALPVCLCVLARVQWKTIRPAHQKFNTKTTSFRQIWIKSHWWLTNV